MTRIIEMIPESPKIYHITHLDNLESIIEDGCLYSDSHCLTVKNIHQNIGISEIKRRRLEEIEVKWF